MPNEVDASCREGSARPIAVHGGAREVRSRAVEVCSSPIEDNAEDNSRVFLISALAERTLIVRLAQTWRPPCQ